MTKAQLEERVEVLEAALREIREGTTSYMEAREIHTIASNALARERK